MFSQRILTATLLACAAACTTPAQDPPGVGEQPEIHHTERNPAHQKSATPPESQQPGTSLEDPATAPAEFPGGEGTTPSPAFVQDQTPPVTR